MATNYQFSLGSDTYSNEFTHTSYGGVTYKGMGINISQYNSHYLKWKYANSTNPEIEVMTPNAPDKIGQVNTNTPAPSGCYGYRKIHTTPQLDTPSVSKSNGFRTTNVGEDVRFIYVPWNKMYTKGLTSPSQFNARNKHPVKYSVIVEEKQANGTWAVAGTSGETCLGITNSVGVQITDWVWKTDAVGTTLAKYLTGTIKKDPTLRDLRYRIIVDPDGEWGLSREILRYMYQSQISVYTTRGLFYPTSKNNGTSYPADIFAPWGTYGMRDPHTGWNGSGGVEGIRVYIKDSDWDDPKKASVEIFYPYHRNSGFGFKLETHAQVASGTSSSYYQEGRFLNAYGNTSSASSHITNTHKALYQAWYANNVNPNTGHMVFDETYFWRAIRQQTSHPFSLITSRDWYGFQNCINDQRAIFYDWQNSNGIPTSSWQNLSSLNCPLPMTISYSFDSPYDPQSATGIAMNNAFPSVANIRHSTNMALSSRTNSINSHTIITPPL